MLIFQDGVSMLMFQDGDSMTMFPGCCFQDDVSICFHDDVSMMVFLVLP